MFSKTCLGLQLNRFKASGDAPLPVWLEKVPPPLAVDSQEVVSALESFLVLVIAIL